MTPKSPPGGPRLTGPTRHLVQGSFEGRGVAPDDHVVVGVVPHASYGGVHHEAETCQSRNDHGEIEVQRRVAPVAAITLVEDQALVLQITQNSAVDEVSVEAEHNQHVPHTPKFWAVGTDGHVRWKEAQADEKVDVQGKGKRGEKAMEIGSGELLLDSER